MENITQINVSDDVSMFLDGDGHVWTAGGQQKFSTILGRLATGGYAATSTGGASAYFGMVYVEEGY